MPPTPAPYRPQDRLSDRIGCTLEVQCRCGRAAMPSVLLLIERRSDQAFEALLPRLRCEACGAPPERVSLVAGRHRACYGVPGNDWAVVVKGSNG